MDHGAPLARSAARRARLGAYGTCGRAGVVACDGMEFDVGSGYGVPTSSVPASAFSTASSATVVSPSEVAGSVGTAVVGAAVKLSAPVKSPVTPRRQALRFGTVTPNLVSISLSVEVASSVPDYKYPPALNGEITRQGVRKPSPIGPAMPSAADGSTVRYSPSVSAGAVTGGT